MDIATPAIKIQLQVAPASIDIRSLSVHSIFFSDAQSLSGLVTNEF